MERFGQRNARITGKMSRMNELPMEDQSAYMLSSKIETYSVAKQSSEVLTFLLLLLIYCFWWPPIYVYFTK